MAQVQIVRSPVVVTLTSLSRPTIYRLIKLGKFPRQIRLSENAVGWDIGEVNCWIQQRKAMRCGVSE